MWIFEAILEVDFAWKPMCVRARLCRRSMGGRAHSSPATASRRPQRGRRPRKLAMPATRRLIFGEGEFAQTDPEAADAPAPAAPSQPLELIPADERSPGAKGPKQNAWRRSTRSERGFGSPTPLVRLEAAFSFSRRRSDSSRAASLQMTPLRRTESGVKMMHSPLRAARAAYASPDPAR